MAKRQDDIEVTEENFGDLLVASLTEARAVARGEADPARRVRRRLTARGTTVQPPRAYEARTIQGIRERMGLSQAVFARVLNASSDTVKAWEQGKRQPDGMALALLEVAERHPDVLLERVSEQPVRGTGKAATG
ncbi:MAG: helix-turn-helix domain-containing protein [Gemmatimonadetes bacterium]|nr:helix-turn-helix domain-containing protein [Gemmatimonadota bacterium]